MKKYYLITIGIFVSLIFLSNSSQHPTNPNGGYTGAPLDGICLECHTNQNSNLSGSFMIEGIPEVAFAGESYMLGINIDNPENDAERAGFQMVALEEDLSNAGELEPAGENIILKVARSRSYIGHSPAVAFDMERIASWAATWTPTESDTGKVTFYGAAMIGSGTDGNKKDRAIFRQWETEVKSPDEAVDVSFIVESGVTCNGFSDATLSVSTRGGIPPFNYTWNVENDTTILENIPAGTYSVTVTDSIGNIDTDTIMISEPDPFVISDMEIVNASNNTNEDGSIAIMVEGGIPPYDAEWLMFPSEEIIGDSLTLENIGAGQYLVIVTDNNNCKTASDTLQVNFNTSISESKEEIAIFPNPASDVIFLKSELNIQAYKIIDISGKTVMHGFFGLNKSIKLKEDLRGFYILWVSDDKNNIYTSRIILR